jgi:hypothetical protein
MVNRWLLKFDVRVARDQYVNEHWEESARRKYLLRPDIAWPLSVDTWVWPSVFFMHGFKDATRDRYATIAVDPTIEGVGYWRDLGRMQAHYSSHRTDAAGGVVVAVELLSERAHRGVGIPYTESGGMECAIALDPVAPPEVPHGSEFLGFDAATAGRWSALNGFEYPQENVVALAAEWGPLLNSHGLFSERDAAVAFRQVSDKRLVNQSPFWVYGLWGLSNE